MKKVLIEFLYIITQWIIGTFGVWLATHNLGLRISFSNMIVVAIGIGVIMHPIIYNAARDSE